ncbi:MAG TPA: YjbH domain-containing protein, partial [Alphaproteobacteria bacterium]|nr:YjbH domain-containing protein [Alphaproteobacteria bacterium]
ISVGLQSALGHKRMAAEYLAMSKRYKDFDFTLGVGWGRMGTRQQIPNPLLLHAFSNDHRALDGESPNRPSDWFTGGAGLFGGVQYDLPIDGLSLKADWNSDKWTAERFADPSFDAPAPWSIGLAYRPYDWIDAGVALQGTDTILARISLSPNLKDWVGRDAPPPSPVNLYPREEKPNPLKKVWRSRETRFLGLDAATKNDFHAQARLDLDDIRSTASQIGQGARLLSNSAGTRPEQIAFLLSRYGMKGPVITINRHDLERAELDRQGSAEEIWRNTSFSSFLPDPLSKKRAAMDDHFSFRVNWVTDLFLLEDRKSVMARTALLPAFTERLGRHFLGHMEFRFNLAENLGLFADYPDAHNPEGRADINLFTQNRFVLERQYLSGFVTLGNDLHAAASLGYLEEMYGGVTGEVLYRPFAKPWALGLEISRVLKRNPETVLAMGMNDDPAVLTSHLNGHYEFANSGATLHASVGRYLAGDVGGTLDLSNTFDNGVRVAASVTATNQTDRDIYGGKTNLYSGISLSLPLGSFPFISEGSRAIMNAGPLGRRTGQRLDTPVSLYEVTEPLSYRAITRHWSELIP